MAAYFLSAGLDDAAAAAYSGGMISDVLFDALEEIERYQREFPLVYSGITSEIEEVKLPMRRLMNKLDTPPKAALSSVPAITDDNIKE